MKYGIWGKPLSKTLAAVSPNPITWALEELLRGRRHMGLSENEGVPYVGVLIIRILQGTIFGSLILGNPRMSRRRERQIDIPETASTLQSPHLPRCRLPKVWKLFRSRNSTLTWGSLGGNQQWVLFPHVHRALGEICSHPLQNLV